MKRTSQLILTASLFSHALFAQTNATPPGNASQSKDTLSSFKAADDDDVMPEILINPSESGALKQKVYEEYDLSKPASFPGGETEMYKFVADHLRYPEEAKEKQISGVVILVFVVEPTGQLNDVHVTKDIGGGCAQEALRLVKSMPLWIPGERDSEKVRVRYVLRLPFKLN